MSTRKRINKLAAVQRELKLPTKQERQDFSDAHAQGLHDEIPREFCPDCDDKKGRTQ